MEKENQNDKIYILLIKCLKGEASEEENIRAAEWINAGESNRKYYNSLRDSWIACSLDNPADDSILNGIWEKIKKESIDLPGKITIVKRMSVYARYAALAILVMVIGGLLFYFISPGQTSFRELAYTVEVPMGARAKITLSDGTVVNLNAGSKLTYTSMYNYNQRSVILTGEAFFDVAANRRIPFIVTASSLSIKALGTSFNVKAYPQDDKVETTLLEGSVRIEQHDRLKSEHILKPNEKLTFLKTNQSIRISELVDESARVQKRVENLKIEKTESVESVTSWKENKLIFENEPLSEMVSKMRRWYGVSIYLQSIDSVDARYSGKFIYNETVYQVLDILSRTTPIHYEIQDHKIYITSKNH